MEEYNFIHESFQCLHSAIATTENSVQEIAGTRPTADDSAALSRRLVESRNIQPLQGLPSEITGEYSSLKIDASFSTCLNSIKLMTLLRLLSGIELSRTLFVIIKPSSTYFVLLLVK